MRMCVCVCTDMCVCVCVYVCVCVTYRVWDPSLEERRYTKSERERERGKEKQSPKENDTSEFSSLSTVRRDGRRGEQQNPSEPFNS